MRFVCFMFLLLGLWACEPNEVVCDASFQTNTVYSPDTLLFYCVRDFDNDTLIYLDSNLVGDLFVVDDSYFTIMGKHVSQTLNIIYQKDTVSYPKVIGFCIYTDNCHVHIPKDLDTLK